MVRKWRECHYIYEMLMIMKQNSNGGLHHIFVWNTTLICQIEPITVICANKSTQDLVLIKMWCAIKWLLLINQL